MQKKPARERETRTTNTAESDGYTPRPTPGCYRTRRLPTADEQATGEQGDE